MMMKNLTLDPFKREWMDPVHLRLKAIELRREQRRSSPFKGGKPDGKASAWEERLNSAERLLRRARSNTPVPKSNLLAEADADLLTSDHLFQEDRQREREINEARSYGGRERHRAHRQLKDLVPGLLKELAPAGGWRSKVEASEKVGCELCRIGAERKNSVSRSVETWTRTALKTIRSERAAADAYDAHGATRSPRQE